MRNIAVGRRNWTFLGAGSGGHRAAVLYSLTASCKQHGLDPFAYLTDVLTRIADHPQARLGDLLPDVWAEKRTEAEQLPQPVPVS